MIFTKKRTKKEWTMTAQQAKELAKELSYIADEANDHQRAYPSQIILEGENIGSTYFSPKKFRIIAVPDEREVK